MGMFSFLPNRSINRKTSDLVTLFILTLPLTHRPESLFLTHTRWLQGLLNGRPSPPPPAPCLLPLNVCMGWGGAVGGPLLVLLFAMRDDVTQLPMVQIATHIWREGSKHLLDLGKEPGVSLNQGRGGARSGGHPRALGRMSLPSLEREASGQRPQRPGQQARTPPPLFPVCLRHELLFDAVQGRERVTFRVRAALDVDTRILGSWPRRTPTRAGPTAPGWLCGLGRPLQLSASVVTWTPLFTSGGDPMTWPWAPDMTVGATLMSHRALVISL